MAITLAYRPGNSALHRVRPGIKLAALFAGPFLLMAAPLPLVCACAAALFLLARRCGFSLKERLSILKPGLYYGLLLYLSRLFALAASAVSSRTAGTAPLFPGAAFFIPAGDTVLFALRLAVIMQWAALIFGTVSVISLNEALAAAETRARAVLRRAFPARVAKEARAAALFGHFLAFMPQIFTSWNELERAWKARGGRGGVKKMRILIYALCVASFYHAARKSRALAARLSGEYR